MLRSLVAAVQLFCVLRAVTSLEIDTSDGGYTNLVVSIDERVHRDESIIKNIKALFRSSSQFLHQATSGRVYFKHVVIDIPLSWLPWRKAGSVSSKSFGKSDVRVVDSSGTHVDHPFTKHVKQCGQRGEFIQLPRTFLAELNTSTTAKYRNPAYVFVHEWAHYRYGVFDEYGSQADDDYPLTYCHKNKVKLNSCSEGIHFTANTETGQKCKIKKNCQFPKDCLIQFFQPKEATMESSIMFMPYQNNIKYFCDNIKRNRTHNSFAPNKQNRFCNGMPAWEVIKHSDDFRKLPRPNMTKSVEPIFEEIRRDRDVKPVVVLVLDVSGSMFMYHRLDFLKEAAARYIQDIPEDSVYLAIVAFESTARLLCCPRHVNRTTRHGFIEAVWKLTYLDGTCIGCGLDLALAVVSNNSGGAVFILMTDGEHIGGLSIASVKPKLIAAKVKVTTVALGSSADSQLEELALDTGGKAYVFEELEGRAIPNILAALVEATTADLDDRVSIKRKEGIFSFPTDVNFLVDDTVGIDTTVHISHLDREKSHVMAWLSDPDGSSCDSCCVDRTWLSETITIPGTAKAGNWTLHMKNPGSRHIDLYVEVKSRARHQDAVPVELACEVSAPVVHVPDLVIYAHLKSGDEVVLDADVFAEVLGPNQQRLSKTPLHDDGHYPDIVANDGTYSGYFTAYTGPGMYTVMARAVNHNQAISATPFLGYSAVPVATVLQANDHTDNQSSEYSIDDFDLLESSNESLSLQGLSTAKKLEAFERAAVKRSFKVATYIYEQDIPPMSIRDLRVNDLRSMSDGTLQVKLAWTWPGAHLTSGKASSVEIRISKDYEELVSMFEEQTPITDDEVVDGSLTPLPSGTKHVVNISLPDIFSTPRGDGGFNYSAALAVRVGNSDGLKSNISNVVSVHHVPPSRKPNPRGVVEDGVDWIWMWVVIGLVVAGVLIAILIVVITKMNLHKRDIYPVFLRKRQTCQDPV